jgi:ADP-heptose:LPS heptosyltransferase
MKKPILLLWIVSSWILYPFFTLASKIKSRKIGTKKRILVLPQLSRIGDIVCSTGVFYNIKKSYPDSYVFVLVSKKAFGIIKNNKKIDGFIIYEDYSFFGLIKKIKSENFNYSINLTATSINTCLTLWSCIENRIKTIVENPPITERLTDCMSNHRLLYKNHTYLPLHHIKLLNFIGINNPEDKKEIWLSETANIKADNFVKSLPPHKKIIGISITAGNKIKELGDERFEKLINKLLENEENIVCCIGSKNDSERIDKIISKVNNPRFIKATDFNLEELPSLMKTFSLYIAVDTGPIYIAHALGVPLIDIIGPVDPTEQPPKDNRSIQILPRGDIKPSSFVFKKRGTKDEIISAIQNTDINDIYKAASILLSK